MMLSRTTARQQRMRQQALNEERLSLGSESSRAGERRSSASKLIISSPTPVTYSLPGYNLPATHSLQNSSGSGKASSANNRVPGSSALLAFLNDIDPVPNANQSPSTSTQSCSRPIDNPVSTTVTASQSNSTLQMIPHRRRTTSGSSHAPPPSSSMDCATIEIDSTVSPLSTGGIDSPIDSCFANIPEDQSSDSFDLNNITPSFQVSSPGAIPVGNNSDFQSSSVDKGPIIASTFCDASSSIHLACSPPVKASASCPTGGGLPDTLHIMASTSPSLQADTPGSGGSSSLGTSGPSLTVNTTSGGSYSTTPSRSVDEQQQHKVAWLRDRTKKDSHNRIERKRRDYINSQISELGHLLPEEMFADGDCRKNKGSILKNSVEFIRALRGELSHVSDIHKETNLAAQVITQLVDRIRSLETSAHLSNPHQMGNKYQQTFEEWTSVHASNMRFRSQGPSSTSSGSVYNTLPKLSEDHMPSSPGFASVNASDLIGIDDNPLFSATPVHMPRTRCTSFNLSELSHSSTSFGGGGASSFSPRITTAPNCYDSFAKTSPYGLSSSLCDQQQLHPSLHHNTMFAKNPYHQHTTTSPDSIQPTSSSHLVPSHSLIHHHHRNVPVLGVDSLASQRPRSMHPPPPIKQMPPDLSPQQQSAFSDQMPIHHQSLRDALDQDLIPGLSSSLPATNTESLFGDSSQQPQFVGRTSNSSNNSIFSSDVINGNTLYSFDLDNVPVKSEPPFGGPISDLRLQTQPINQTPYSQHHHQPPSSVDQRPPSILSTSLPPSNGNLADLPSSRTPTTSNPSLLYDAPGFDLQANFCFDDNDGDVPME